MERKHQLAECPFQLRGERDTALLCHNHSAANYPLDKPDKVGSIPQFIQGLSYRLRVADPESPLNVEKGVHCELFLRKRSLTWQTDSTDLHLQ